MQIKKLEVGGMGTNCYLAWCAQSNQAIVIDPGAQPGIILRAIKELNLSVLYIVNTHGHLDHIGANRDLQTALNCPIVVGEADAYMLTDAKANLSQMLGQPITSPAAELLLQDGDELNFGSCSVVVLSTPGHTPGGIGLYGHGVLFAGDTLFQGSIGRSDLPGGRQKTLLDSIKTKFLTLSEDTRVMPGHGPDTTIGAEKKNNPWLQG